MRTFDCERLDATYFRLRGMVRFNHAFL